MTSTMAAMSVLGSRGKTTKGHRVCCRGGPHLLRHLMLLGKLQARELQRRRIGGGGPRLEAGKMCHGARSLTSLVKFIGWDHKGISYELRGEVVAFEVEVVHVTDRRRRRHTLRHACGRGLEGGRENEGVSGCMWRRNGRPAAATRLEPLVRRT